MARAYTPKVLTANDLLEGDVIYKDGSGSWTRHHAEAHLYLEEQEAEAALKDAHLEAGQIVGPYLADAKDSADGPLPTHFREAYRTRGPSNYAHGKQVELTHV